jgi:hypothetical protein
MLRSGPTFSQGLRSGSGSVFQLNQGRSMSLWLLILIIVIVVLLLGGFGYSRR